MATPLTTVETVATKPVAKPKIGVRLVDMNTNPNKHVFDKLYCSHMFVYGTKMVLYPQGMSGWGLFLARHLKAALAELDVTHKCVGLRQLDFRLGGLCGEMQRFYCDQPEAIALLITKFIDPVVAKYGEVAELGVPLCRMRHETVQALVTCIKKKVKLTLKDNDDNMDWLCALILKYFKTDAHVVAEVSRIICKSLHMGQLTDDYDYMSEYITMCVKFAQAYLSAKVAPQITRAIAILVTSLQSVYLDLESTDYAQDTFTAEMDTDMRTLVDTFLVGHKMPTTVHSFLYQVTEHLKQLVMGEVTSETKTQITAWLTKESPPFKSLEQPVIMTTLLFELLGQDYAMPKLVIHSDVVDELWKVVKNTMPNDRTVEVLSQHIVAAVANDELYEVARVVNLLPEIIIHVGRQRVPVEVRQAAKTWLQARTALEIKQCRMDMARLESFLA